MQTFDNVIVTEKLGIGTSPPSEDSTGAVTFYPPDGFAWFHIDNGPAGGRPIGRLRFSGGNKPGDVEYMCITQDGKVGIGTTNPREKLHVEGTITVSKDIVLHNADCAEEFDISVLEEYAEAGNVMTLDSEGKLRCATEAYDKRVAGVISGAGNFKPGLILDKQSEQANRMPIALMGKVYCKVDAQYTPIEVGDLLTTSPTPGHAMKASDPIKAFGTVIGKALMSLDAGKGLIPIMVALQ